MFNIFLLIVCLFIADVYSVCYVYSSNIDYEYYLENNGIERTVLKDSNDHHCTEYDNLNESYVKIDSFEDMELTINYIYKTGNDSKYKGIGYVKAALSLYYQLKDGLYGSDVTKFICQQYVHVKYEKHFKTNDRNVSNFITDVICENFFNALTMLSGNKANKRTPGFATYNESNWPIKSHYLEAVRLLKIKNKVNPRKRRVYDFKLEPQRTTQNSSTLSFLKALYKSVYLYRNNMHPVSNNLRKHIYEGSMHHVNKYYDKHSDSMSMFIDLFTGLYRETKKFWNKVPPLKVNLTYHLLYPSEEEVNQLSHYIVHTLNDSTPLNVTDDEDEDETVVYFNILRIFTLDYWNPFTANWKSHSRAEGKYTFDIFRPGDWISKILFYTKCWRRFEIIRDTLILSPWYLPENPDRGEFRCFHWADEVTFPNSTVSKFSLLDPVIPKKYQKTIASLNPCSKYLGFKFYWDAFFLVPKVIINGLVQPQVCSLQGGSFDWLFYLVAFEHADCSSDTLYLEYPLPYCLLITWFGFLAFQIVLISFLFLYISNCCSMI